MSQMSPVFLEDLQDELERESGNGKLTHIIAPKIDGEGNLVDAHVLVMESRINGTMLEALCGWKWVPQDNPDKYPICGICKDIAKSGGRNPDNMSQ
jgi:hypothetical protein